MMKWATEAGATCRGFDPVASANVEKENPGKFTIVDDLYETLKGADALVISTDWDEFKQPDFGKIKTLLSSPVVFDGAEPLQARADGPARLRVLLGGSPAGAPGEGAQLN